MDHKIGVIPFDISGDNIAIMFVTSQRRGRWRGCGHGHEGTQTLWPHLVHVAVAAKARPLAHCATSLDPPTVVTERAP
mgnify:CR=1 FL=1